MPKAIMLVDSRATTEAQKLVALANLCREMRNMGRTMEALMNNMKATPDFTLLEAQYGVTVGTALAPVDGQVLFGYISGLNTALEASNDFKNICEKIVPKV